MFPSELERGPDSVATLDPTRVLLTFSEAQGRRELSEGLRSLDLVLEDGEDREGGEGGEGGEDRERPSEPINHTDRRWWARVRSGEIDDDRLRRIGDTLGPRLQSIAPVYRTRGARERTGLFCPLPNVLLIRFAGGAEDQRQVEEEFGLQQEDDDREFADGFGSQAYRRYVIPDLAPNAYRLRAPIQERVAVDDVRFENMPMVSPYSMQLVDPLCPQQWNMERIVAQATNPGSITGWDYSLGDSGIAIAIIDTGCDLDHPDLRILPGLSFGNPTGNGETQPTGGFAPGHGTLCAGVAAATANNLKGLAGVAGRCLILPIAFKDGTDYEFFRGLVYATDRGARVVSMSFSIYDDVWDTAFTSQAVTYAYARNVVMCAASGNGEKDFMAYPASDTRVIACGASTHTLPEDRVSTGAGYTFGSNYGGGLSVVAPGVDVPTTAVQGTGSGGAWGADYVSGFFGTSAATPHVAGLAALILSVRPTLTAARVRAIIESTTDKIGAAAFDTRGVNGTWNRFVGYGRINVLKAMRKTYAPFDIYARLDAHHLPRLTKAMEAHASELDRIDREGGDPALAEVHRSWLRLGSDDGILRLVRDLIEDPSLLDQVRNEPQRIADARGILLPKGAEVMVECASTADGSQPRELRVRYSVGALMASAGWNAETGFFGDIEPAASAVSPTSTVPMAASE